MAPIDSSSSSYYSLKQIRYKDKIKTSIERHTSIHKWLIQIYATRGISAWKSYNKTCQEYVALMDLQST